MERLGVVLTAAFVGLTAACGEVRSAPEAVLDASTDSGASLAAIPAECKSVHPQIACSRPECFDVLTAHCAPPAGGFSCRDCTVAGVPQEKWCDAGIENCASDEECVEFIPMVCNNQCGTYHYVVPYYVCWPRAALDGGVP